MYEFDKLSFCKMSQCSVFIYKIVKIIFSIRESVAEPNDLYASFDRVLIDHNYTFGNKLTVNEFMSNWTSQSGYPILHIKKNEATNMFSVTQVNIINRISSACAHYNVCTRLY